MEAITDNNKLIAEFMGNHIKESKNYYEFFAINSKPYSVEELKFHSDWNWLMEVVEKIENLGFEFFIVESRCKIAHNTDKSIEILIGFELVSKKIESVYYNCVEFIKWYNQQKIN